MDINFVELEKEIIREIDAKKELKNKIEKLEKVYDTIQKENTNFSNKHNGYRIPELSRLSGALFQTIGKFKRELSSFEPEKSKTIIV